MDKNTNLKQKVKFICSTDDSKHITVEYRITANSYLDSNLVSELEQKVVIPTNLYNYSLQKKYD